MIKRSFILSFLLLLAIRVPAKSFAYVSFSGISDTMLHYYNDLKITVNGIQLQKKDIHYKIPLHDKGLDTIIVIHSQTSRPSVILTKFGQGKKYRFAYNPCSTFEIIPQKKVTRTQLVRFILLNKTTTPLYLISPTTFIDLPQELRSEDTTRYHINAFSGYCPYAVTSFAVCSTEEPDNNEYNNPEICSATTIQFFGTEKYTLVYDPEKKKLNVVFDGYYNRKTDAIELSSP
jgi:hypothetical protein